MNKEQIDEIALRVAKEVALRHGDSDDMTDYDTEVQAFIIDHANTLLAELAKQSNPVVQARVDDSGQRHVEGLEAYWLLQTGKHNLFAHPLPQDDLATEIERLSEKLRDSMAQSETDAGIIKSDGKEIHFLRQQLSAAQADNDGLLKLLDRASTSLGAFTSDEGWTQRDMDTMDSVDSAIATHKARQKAPSAEQAAAHEWQPIETAPKDGTMFIGWVGAERWSSPDGGGSGCAYDTSQVDFCWWQPFPEVPEAGYFYNCSGQIGDAQEVTHWMPLPASPERTS